MSSRTYGISPAGESGAGDEIRKFNDSGIQAQIDRALQTLPEKANGAVIGYYDMKTNTVSAAVVARVGKNFSVVGVLNHNINASIRDVSGAAAVRWTW